MSSWTGRTIGGIFGFLVGGPVGAVIGAGIGYAIDESNEPATVTPHAQIPQTNRLPNLSATVHYEDDDLGRLLSFNIQGQRLPEHTVLVIFLKNNVGVHLKGRGDYIDKDGDFCLSLPLSNNTASAYLPFSAVNQQHNQCSKLHLTAVTRNSEHENFTAIAETEFEISLPAHNSFSMVEIIRPLITLAMHVVKADTIIKPEEIRLLKKFFVNSFSIDDAELNNLKQAFKAPISEPLEVSVARCKRRIPALNVTHLIEFLSGVALCDGEVDVREYAIIKKIGLHLGIKETELETLLASNGLNNIANHYATLGVEPGCTKEAMIKSYRRMAAMYHPDKVAGLAPEFQELAKRRFIEIRQAYEELIKTF